MDIRYEHFLHSVEGTMGNVAVTFENVAQYQASLLIAADGVHSTGMSFYFILFYFILFYFILFP